jgi:hypothetical protein
MTDDGLQIRAPRFDSGRRLHSISKHANDFGVQSQAPDPTQTLEPGGKLGGCSPPNQPRALRALLWLSISVAFLVAAILCVSLPYPETMHQVRLVLLLLAIGGPDG